MKTSLKLLALPLGLIAACLTSAQAATLLNDQFNDGDKVSTTASGGEVLATSGWFGRDGNPSTRVTVASNAMSINPNGSSAQATAYYPSFTLTNIGDSITFTADVRFNTAIPNVATGLGIALFNSGGSKDTVDGNASTVARNDDLGFVARINPANTGVNTGTGQYDISEKIVTNSDHFTVTQRQDLTPTAAWLANTTYSVLFSITQTATGLEVGSSVSGGIMSYTSYVDTTPTTSTFDTVSVFAASQTSGLVGVDNIVITSVPEPTTMLLLTGGLTALTLFRRRRF